MKKVTNRRGFGIPTLFALMVPALVLVVAIGHMFQASGVRRMTTASFASYAAGEIVESALAEAAHLMSVSQMFPDGGAEQTFTTRFIQGLLADQCPADQDHREYWSLLDDQGAEAQKMLVAFSFQEAEGQEIPLKGLAKAAAEANPGFTIANLRVTVRPLTFRREFFKDQQKWNNWGLVRFRARVSIDDGNGPETHGQMAIKIFTLKPSGTAGDVVEFSDRNVRTFVQEPNRRRRR